LPTIHGSLPFGKYYITDSVLYLFLLLPLSIKFSTYLARLNPLWNSKSALWGQQEAVEKLINSNVTTKGKTATTIQFVSCFFIHYYGNFNSYYFLTSDPTVEDRYRKRIMYGGTKGTNITLEILDTAGTEQVLIKKSHFFDILSLLQCEIYFYQNLKDT
jgi:hypothetical protein